MPLAHLDDRSIGYADTGGDGPAVLCLPSLPLDRSAFEPQARALSGTARVVRLDLPGLGESPIAPQPYTLADVADGAAALLTHLDIDEATVVASGFGSAVALRLALRHPSRVAGLLLIAVDAAPPDPLTVAGYRMMVDAWGDDGPSPEIAEAFQESMFAPIPALGRAWRKRWRTVPNAAMRDGIEALCRSDDVRSRLASIVCPARVMHGAADGARDVAGSRRVAELLPGAPAVEIVPDGAHALSLSHPALVTERLRTLITAGKRR